LKFSLLLTPTKKRSFFAEIAEIAALSLAWAAFFVAAAEKSFIVMNN
jgi:hypothetical protein